MKTPKIKKVNVEVKEFNIKIGKFEFYSDGLGLNCTVKLDGKIIEGIEKIDISVATAKLIKIIMRIHSMNWDKFKKQ